MTEVEAALVAVVEAAVVVKFLLNNHFPHFRYGRSDSQTGWRGRIWKVKPSPELINDYTRYTASPSMIIAATPLPPCCFPPSSERS